MVKNNLTNYVGEGVISYALSFCSAYSYTITKSCSKTEISGHPSN